MAPRPYNLVAELTYRCPLRCTYCSNPVDYRAHREALDGEAWSRAFAEGAALGCVHVGLTGGEPTLHPDLPEIVAGAAKTGLFVHLVTAGTTLSGEDLAALVECGLKSVQLSVQDSRKDASDAVAGATAFETKLAFAEEVRRQGLPLTLNVVLHRGNLDRVGEIIALAREVGASRLELANTQYAGWALVNRDALMPSREQLDRASQAVEAARREHDSPEILYVLPDYFADRPKPCMGGWGQRILVMAPDGSVLPCHGAAELPLEFWRYPEHDLASCWERAPGMQAYRGEAWMKPPCRGCPERAKDFGGCRCQAFQQTGDPAATDPACALSPHHSTIVEARSAAPNAVPVHRGDAWSRPPS